MGFFDYITQQAQQIPKSFIDQAKEKLAQSNQVFDKIATFVNPSPIEVRPQDIIREIPGAINQEIATFVKNPLEGSSKALFGTTAANLGTMGLRSYATAEKLITGKNPSWEPNITKSEKNLYGTGEKALLTTIGTMVELTPLILASMPPAKAIQTVLTASPPKILSDTNKSSNVLLDVIKRFRSEASLQLTHEGDDLSRRIIHGLDSNQFSNFEEFRNAIQNIIPGATSEGRTTILNQLAQAEQNYVYRGALANGLSSKEAFKLVDKLSDTLGKTTVETLETGGTVAAGATALGAIRYNKLVSRSSDKQLPITSPNQLEINKLPSNVPKEYNQTIIDNGVKYGVDPVLIGGLIKYENPKWNPRFKNPEGTATGLMQINDATYKDISKKIGSFDRKDPKQNIRAGVFWLNEIAKRIGTNDPKEVAQAYNVGISGYLNGKRNLSYLSKVLENMK